MFLFNCWIFLHTILHFSQGQDYSILDGSKDYSYGEQEIPDYSEIVTTDFSPLSQIARYKLNEYIKPTTHRPNYVPIVVKKPNREVSLNEYAIPEEEYDDDYKNIGNKYETENPDYYDTEIENEEVNTTDKTTDWITQNNNSNLDSIISVVTTKSVVNNTLLPSFTLDKLKTEVVTPKIDENWVIVGSIQTNLSVSETRSVEKKDDINNNNLNINRTDEPSTESLIDKLDRVQSDLSNRLLTVNFREVNNNSNIIINNENDTTYKKSHDEIYPEANIITSTELILEHKDIENSSTESLDYSTDYIDDEIPETNSMKSIEYNASLDKTSVSSLQEDKLSKLISKFEVTDISKLLPADYKLKVNITNSTEVPLTDYPSTTSNFSNKIGKLFEKAEVDDISKFLPPGYKPKNIYKNNKHEEESSSTLTNSGKTNEVPHFVLLGKQTNENKLDNKVTTEKSRSAIDTKKRLTGSATIASTNDTNFTSLFKNVKEDVISKFLPPGYNLKLNETLPLSNISMSRSNNPSVHNKLSNMLKNSTEDDISKFLPPGYKTRNYQTTTTTSSTILKYTPDDISKFLPSGYKTKTSKPSTSNDKSKVIFSNNTTPNDKLSNIFKNAEEDDISKFLPPGYKSKNYQTSSTTATPPDKLSNIFKHAEEDDISKFLPPGYKSKNYQTSSTTATPPDKLSNIFKHAEEDNISKFLPPGYKTKAVKLSTSNDKPNVTSNNTTSNDKLSNIFKNAQEDDISKFLPPGYKTKSYQTSSTTVSPPIIQNKSSDLSQDIVSTTVSSTTTKASIKIKFPTRPNQPRKTPRTSTAPPRNSESQSYTTPTIHIGWPSRARTEFTGWPTPSTTPISIEKLLEASRIKELNETEEEEVDATLTTTTTTTMATTTTTTVVPTTPGVCNEQCELSSTIKLVGIKWVPELLDRNTNEWQELSNEVGSLLENLYLNSTQLKQYFKKIRIDGFSKGSVFVDYVIELKNITKKLNTLEIKDVFHTDLRNKAYRSGKSINEEDTEILPLGRFDIDTKYTDFIVAPSQINQNINTENQTNLPQWIVAAIVMGVASLLFILMFGVTVLLNRGHAFRKKSPQAPNMMAEFNKSNVNNIDVMENYDVNEVLDYNWRERNMTPQKDYLRNHHFDSWKSEWNGYYYNEKNGNPHDYF